MFNVKQPIIHTEEEQGRMRIVSKLAASCLEMLSEHVKPGTSTLELDAICHAYIVNDIACIPACLGYRGYPNTLCISINDVVCHGIPTAEEIIKDGDIVNIDVTVIKDEFHGDTSKMFLVGDVSATARHLADVSYKAMVAGIRAVRPGLDIGVVGSATQEYMRSTPFSTIAQFSGHGIGRVFHDSPPVLAYHNRLGVTMEPGMTFTVEPIVAQHGPDHHTLDDEWTVCTDDGGLSAQHEHTILVTDDGYEILSLRSDEEPF